MKTLTLIILLLISISLNAQVFAPNEAVWYYSYDPDVTLDDGYQKIEVVGDTLINDKLCKILQRTNIGYNYWYQDYYEIVEDEIFIYEKDSVVYFKNDSLFHILYDFSAKAGDSFYSISLISSCNEPFLVEIDSITTIDFDDVLLKKFHIGDYYYLERIGYPAYMFRFQIPCEPVTGSHYPGPLRCYFDNIVGNLSSNIVSGCNYITSSNQIGVNNNSIKIYPNPSQRQECINIEISDENVKKITIYNLLGQLIKNYSIADNKSATISIENSGNYIVCFNDKNDRIVYRKKLSVD
uniref:T9SS type A sorting domain-containing protein n=1 Tax=uncultured Draconibacterium sp. TaxID=1573823 RepID=UPI0032168357